MASNDLKRKVGKLLIIGFDGKTLPDPIKEMIHDYHIGGIILFGRNIGTPQELLTLTSELQKEAKRAGYEHPLLICVDQENGVVRRLGEGTTIFPGAMTLGATDDPENAFQVGLSSGAELKALGINWNLSPVVDVNNNPENPVIGVRSFGESAEKVAAFGKGLMKGMQKAGVITTLKHFPGHGDTDVDSHLDLPIISHSKERLDEIELLPFKENIETGADTVMTAHVYFPAIEPNSGVPATLSEKVITGLLRKELGFKGVVTTDCMEMNAIADGIGTSRGAVEAVKAGVDLVMVSHTLEKQLGVITEMIEAVESGELAEVKLDEANERIDVLKRKYLNWDEIPLKGHADVPDIVGSAQHKEIADEVYRQSVTIVKNDHTIPVQLNDNERVLVVCPENGTTMQVEDKRYATLSLDEAVKHYHKETDAHYYNGAISEEEIDTIVEKAKNYDFLVIGTLSIRPGSKQISLVDKLHQTGQPYVVVAMRSPYDLQYLPNVKAYINTYEFTYPMLEITAGAIFGKEEVSGKLPVTIPSKG
ncbi:beta-N-acetylhexosaminidase [Oceanobacillus luteolus]|uniref:Beta-N-acetylhexosaminidase n=1 Tax=Oceanobacillus luteolus TaxID=1274358 RepID=A0ABW4HRZ5_9BACI